jgi:NADH-quinone oxidoreductase subunit N
MMNLWTLFVPELYCLLMAVVFFGLALSARPNPRRDYFVALFMAGVGMVVALACVRLEGTLFFEAYRVDLFSQVFKVMLAMGFFLVVCLCTELNGIEERHHPEFYLFLTTCTLAMMMLVSSVELLTIYVALELSSYSLLPSTLPWNSPAIRFTFWSLFAGGMASMWRPVSSTSWWGLALRR